MLNRTEILLMFSLLMRVLINIAKRLANKSMPDSYIDELNKIETDRIDLVRLVGRIDGW